MDYGELTNVIPLHLLLTYLVHQIDLPHMPSLFEFLRLSRAQYLEEAALPLWEEKPQALESLKANLRQEGCPRGIAFSLSETTSRFCWVYSYRVQIINAVFACCYCFHWGPRSQPCCEAFVCFLVLQESI